MRSWKVGFEIVPGGHLGMLTGLAAGDATTPTATKAPTKKSATMSTLAKRAPARTASSGGATIGTNRSRRYGSAGSRSLNQ